MRLRNIFFLASALLTIPCAQSQSLHEIKSSVSFIYLPNAKGAPEANGTGFFVGVEDTVRQRTYIYTITSKHVLWDSAKKRFAPNAWLRLNTKVGDASFVTLVLRTSGDSQTVFTHQDPTVDLVAVAGVPDQDKYEFTYLPSQIIRTGQDLRNLGLGEGTDVLFPALFVPHVGEHRNYPIVRFGKLALVPNERIFWDGQLQQLYLIEAISIGGHSGAPVFAWFEPRAKPGTVLSYEEKRVRLIGVMQGFFEQERPLGVRQTGLIPVYGSHTGISAIVPIQLMQEILFGPDAMRIRKKP